MKMSHDKILTLVIAGLILAGTGGYALADQAARPSAVSSTITSSQVASAFETSKMEASSMAESSQTSQEVSNTTESIEKTEPKSEPESTPKENTERETSMKPNTDYYVVIDPDTGRYIQPRDPRYFEIRNRLGGDAGTVPPNKSSACAPYIQKWKQIEQEKDRAENKQLAPDSTNPESIDTQ